MIIEKAHAKINLTLDVLRKRSDGYHEVEMVMQQIALSDTLKISKANKAGIFISSNLEGLPLGRENLAYRAAEKLLEYVGADKNTGINIDIEKNIPVAAGLAGGSSNAAAAMVGINSLLELGLTKEQLMDLAAPLGADIPFCILGGTALAKGKGEELTPLAKVPKIPIILVKPSFGVSTAEVYGNLKLEEITERPDTERMLKAIKAANNEEIANSLGNILESVTLKLYPELSQIADNLTALGAKSALMSGSGPTFFGILPPDLSIGKRLRNHFAQKGFYTYLTSTI